MEIRKGSKKNTWNGSNVLVLSKTIINKTDCKMESRMMAQWEALLPHSSRILSVWVSFRFLLLPPPRNMPVVGLAMLNCPRVYVALK